MSKMMMIIIEHLDFQMIAVFFISSESSDFEKRSIERELASSEKIMSSSSSAASIDLMKNSLINLLTSASLADMSMCLQCSKILKIDASIQCIRSYKFI